MKKQEKQEKQLQPIDKLVIGAACIAAIIKGGMIALLIICGTLLLYKMFVILEEI